jgi:hypothetical protein
MGSHLTESGMLFLMLLKFGHLLEFCNIWHLPRLIYLTVLILYVNKCMLLLLITSMHWIVFYNMLRAPIVIGLRLSQDSTLLGYSDADWANALLPGVL